ncbi:MAG: hypothetical protein WC785_10175 [Tatlockia sp.]|jgi:hypothetical protein
MKKLVIAITCLLPVFSLANTAYTNNDLFIEQCAKEHDPVKRQNACHILENHSESLNNLPEYHQETATV